VGGTITVSFEAKRAIGNDETLTRHLISDQRIVRGTDVRVQPVLNYDQNDVESGNLVFNHNLPDKLLIKVADNGIGIAPENQHKMFQQFTHFDANNLQGNVFTLISYVIWLSHVALNRR